MTLFKKLFSGNTSSETKNSSDPEASKETPKWHETLVLICEKCGKKMMTEGSSKNPTLELKDSVKRDLVAEGHWGNVRVSTSSCLDICPDGKIAVSFTGDQKNQPTIAYSIDPVQDREWLKKKIISRSEQTK